MGLLPVPDEVRSMHAKIDHLAESINSQKALLDKVLQRTLQLGSYEKELKDLQNKLEYLSNSVTTIKDCVRFK